VSLKKVAVFFTLFVLPGLAILFLASGDHVFSTLPYFGPKEPYDTVIDGETVSDTNYFVVPPFGFTNMYGNKFHEDSVKGKNYVVNFFFTRCKTICPIITTQMRRVQEATIDLEDFMILSHTIDPKNDTLESMQEYAKKYHADRKIWQFLRADQQYTHDFAKEGYYLHAASDENAQGGFLHSEFVMLIDRDRHIRGLYKGTDTEDVDRLIEELKVLLKEQKLEDRANERENS